MSVRPWNGVLLLQLYVILSFARFLQAQILFPATANMSTSWKNHPSVSSDNIILFNPKPDAGYRFGFACGFYSHQLKEDAFYFAIGYAEIQIDFTSGKQNGYFEYVIWIANRNQPVGENATVELLPEGNLVLKHADGSVVWSTNTSDKSVAGMKMMETGSLVLHDVKNRTIWQSFDYPTDTLVPGQIWVSGMSLVASISESNVSEGNYFLIPTSDGLHASYHDGATRIKYRYLNYTDLPDSLILHGSYLYVDDMYNASTFYIRFDPDGHLRVYGRSKYAYDVFGENYGCDYPNYCGNDGLCLDGSCTCPWGFEEGNDTNGQGKSGCSRMIPITCENPWSYYMIPYEDFYYLGYDGVILNETDKESCREACLKNCTCAAALFRYYNSPLIGNCLSPSPHSSLINGRRKGPGYRSYAFIKIYNDGGTGKGFTANKNAERGSPTSVLHTEIIAGSTIVAFLLVCVVVGYFWMIHRKISWMNF